MKKSLTVAAPLMAGAHNMGYVVFLSVVAALGGFLFGYDTAVISGTIDQVTVQYHLNPIQQGWYVGCALVGSIMGVLAAGVFSDRWGRKKTMIASAVLFTVSGMGCAISGNIDELVIYRIVGGIGIGVVSIISPLYISEVAITKYRGRLVSLYQLAITIGFLGAYLVNYELLKVAVSGAFSGNALLSKIFVTESWRGMLGMESLPAFLFFLIIFFIPESPRWLIAQRQGGRALAIMGRIYRDPREVDVRANEVRQQLDEGRQSDLRLLFRPSYFKALMIGVAIAILGQFMGVNAVLYYGPTIFRNSGLSDGDSLLYQVLVGVVNALTTVLALLIIDKVGRKKLVYYGVSGMIVTLLLIGLYFIKGQEWKVPAGLLLTFFLLYIFCCAVSICAVIWVLLSEMYPTAVRGIAMSIAGFSLWIGTYLIGQLTPWMLTTLSPAGTFFLFACMCLPYLWIVRKLVPETAGRSLEEIERMWIH
ncbi:MAG: sugar porter family MFS transporter [Chitinophagaceae bacterium]|nr:sugar porter family MFS transporter [Chitinophagaceae bacterium]